MRCYISGVITGVKHADKFAREEKLVRLETLQVW